MKLNFTKMQGIGNDYVYINCLENYIDNPGKLAEKLSDRRFGIGGDGIILIDKSDTCDFKMRIFNIDGSEAEMCGNGIRCVGKYVYDKGLTKKETITIETLGGAKVLKLNIVNNKVATVRVDMGVPEFNPAKIPVITEQDSIINMPLKVGDVTYYITCISTGNPHCVIFVDDVDNLEIEKIGPRIENHIIFSNRANVEFVKVLDKNNLKMRVWERGSNETLACGTGACAVLAAAVANGYSNKKANIKLLGGELDICWEDDNHIYMTGPCELVFEGTIEV